MSKYTPEGAVKALVKNMLEDIGCVSAGKAVSVSKLHRGWYYMPVSSGMGVHGIPDFIISYMGKFIAVETKAPKKTPTALQNIQLRALTQSGAITAVVDSKEGVELLKKIMIGDYE